jgi:hypothetical protein
MPPHKHISYWMSYFTFWIVNEKQWSNIDELKNPCGGWNHGCLSVNVYTLSPIIVETFQFAFAFTSEISLT